MPPADVFSDVSSWIVWLRIHSQQFPDLCYLLHCLSLLECCFGYFVLGCLDLHMGLFQQPLGFVDLDLHPIQFCASLHLLAGMALLLVGHQFPLYGLDGSRDFALVVDDDDSTQLARFSLSCTICPGLDQLVTTSLRRDPVVEILWHLRSRRGGCCTRWIILATSQTTRPPSSSAFSVCGTVGRWESRHPYSVEVTVFRGEGNMADVFRVK